SSARAGVGTRAAAASASAANAANTRPVVGVIAGVVMSQISWSLARDDAMSTLDYAHGADSTLTDSATAERGKDLGGHHAVPVGRPVLIVGEVGLHAFAGGLPQAPGKTDEGDAAFAKVLRHDR